MSASLTTIFVGNEKVRMTRNIKEQAKVSCTGTLKIML